MISTRKLNGRLIRFWLCLLILASFPLASRGQAKAGDAEADRTFPALLVSDIHFDPLHDPGKARQLVDAPASQWRSILSAPPSPNQQPAFAELQQKCNARGVDTPYDLLRSSLQAMQTHQPDAKFMALSGDLLTHNFTCRYTTLFPESTQSDYQAFVLKTLSFVMGELRAGFPGVPIYVALGNNDTACGDYRLDPGSDFLAKTGSIIAEGLPSSQRRQALDVFAKGGYYSLMMKAPMRNTRLIVVNDIFLSPGYRTCAGGLNSAAATAEMAWLQRQLAQARRLKQRVWLMGHIPPGVDPYSTALKFTGICGKQAPVTFLSSDKLADWMIEYADVIRLGIFAHSHMDEFRLLEPEGIKPLTSFERSTASRVAHNAGNESAKGVAIKIAPSISPVDGNNPSFTVARVAPDSATLQDYAVIAASNQTGVATTWSTEYDYAQAYHAAQFSPSALETLIAKFQNDRGANTELSQEYIRNYFAGDLSVALRPFWPLYVCTLNHHTANAFAACVCSATNSATK